MAAERERHRSHLSGGFEWTPTLGMRAHIWSSCSEASALSVISCCAPDVVHLHQRDTARVALRGVLVFSPTASTCTIRATKYRAAVFLVDIYTEFPYISTMHAVIETNAFLASAEYEGVTDDERRHHRVHC
jgi:hypothetical protein